MAQIKINATYGLTGTLPAVSGANLTSLNGTQVTSGTLPMARLSGTLPALNGSALTTLNATNISSGTLNASRYTDTAGKIVQIKRAYATSTTSTSSSSYTHFSGIDLSITPTSASNKILMFFSSNFDNNASGRQGDVSCWREISSSNVLLVDSIQQPAYSVSSTRVVGSVSWVFQDEPDTTSAVRYRPVVRSNTGNQVGMGGFATSLILMEATIS
jgi:hypothetical protein